MQKKLEDLQREITEVTEGRDVVATEASQGPSEAEMIAARPPLEARQTGQ